MNPERGQADNSGFSDKIFLGSAFFEPKNVIFITGF
jgi:hypothetical protein